MTEPETGHLIGALANTGEPVMTNTVVHLEAALEDSLPFIYELWMSLDATFKLSREDLL